VSREVVRVPRWAVITTFALSLVGLGLSMYLTIAHYEGKQILACSTTGTLNCGLVTTSAQSHFLGLPVADLGLATYIVMVILNSPWGWRLKSYWVHVARFILAIGAMVFVLWLVYAELIIINHICEYCTGVHIVTFALLIVLTRVSPVQLGWTNSRAP
jgi:uncharacterized membrane protein